VVKKKQKKECYQQEDYQEGWTSNDPTHDPLILAYIVIAWRIVNSVDACGCFIDLGGIGAAHFGVVTKG
jgi:hypothetical protein